MTDELKIFETKLRVYARCRGKCEVCGKPMSIYEMQMAHRVPKTKFYLKKYGKEIVHNDMNLAATCSLKCNSSVLLDPKTHPIEAQELIEKIKESL